MYRRFLENLQEWILHIKTKKNIYINERKEMSCFFSLTENYIPNNTLII